MITKVELYVIHRINSSIYRLYFISSHENIYNGFVIDIHNIVINITMNL